MRLRNFIFHYTTMDGFLGILESKCLHASNVFFLNDARDQKRKLRQQAFLLTRNDILKQSFRFDRFDPFYVDRILGGLSFWISVEPTARFPRAAKEAIVAKVKLLEQGEAKRL
jgi:hypothetical protein